MHSAVNALLLYPELCLVYNVNALGTSPFESSVLVRSPKCKQISKWLILFDDGRLRCSREKLTKVPSFSEGPEGFSLLEKTDTELAHASYFIQTLYRVN